MDDKNAANQDLFTEDELKEIFNESGEEKPATSQMETGDGQKTEEGNNTPADDGKKEITDTQKFAQRLKEEKAKAKQEALEEVAIQSGYKNYAEMIAASEKKKFEDKGYDPEEAKKLFDEMYEEKKKSDPSFKKLSEYEEQQKILWAKNELESLNKSAGTKFKTIEELPKEVADLWAKGIDLPKAYFAVEGPKLVKSKEISNAQQLNAGSTGHLKSLSGGAGNETVTYRPYTAEEMRQIKAFRPDVTEEELRKGFAQNKK